MNLQLKLLLPGIGTWLIFFLVFNFYWQPNNLLDQQTRFANSLQQQARLLDKGLTDYLLQNNQKLVHTMLNKVVEDSPEWKQIIVKDVDGKQIYPLVEVAGTVEDSWVTVENEIFHLENKLATLVLVADQKKMLSSHAACTQELNVLLLVLLAIMIFVSLNLQAVLLRNPLKKLAIAANRIASGEFDIVLPDSSGDELGQLASGFHSMSNNLNLALDKLRNESELVQKSANALRKSEERFSLAISGSNDGIWDWDLESSEIFFSPRWKQMLGYEENDIGNSFNVWRNLIYPDDLGRFLDLWAKHIANENKFFYIEYRIRRKTGDYSWVLCRGLSSRDEAGCPIRISGSQTDIAPYKKAEQERQQLHHQLQQSQKMEAIGQLTGGIAHDFNNMLASIMGYTELICEDMAQYGDKQIEDYLGEVYKSSKRARDLVAQMLAFSRGGEDELKPHKLSPLVKESLTMLGSILPSSIEISLQLERDDLVIKTNPVQLHQLIMNLCINARDAMEEKGHLTIGLQHVTNVETKCCSCHENIVGDYIQLFVRDTGSGIKLEQLDRIFDPFYTTKDAGKGSGMGLPMVHGLMHDHGGHVVVETGTEGTTIILLFPIVDNPLDTVNRENVGVNISPDKTAVDGNILIVDDEVSVGHYIGELLKGRGYHVTVETDSRLALSKFKENPGAFDLMVTDQTMPGLTGAELAQSFLTIRPELPVVLCTGYSEHIDRVGAKALGISGYVNKPIETEEFLGLVGNLLQVKLESRATE